MIAPGHAVLVIDDSSELLGFVELLLCSEGYAVRTAATLEQAERALAEGTPQLVIADVRMPPHPPFAVLDHLAADPVTRDLPVLLCTGAVHDLQAAPERLRRPRTEALLKPFEIEDLLLCVERLLAGQSRPANDGALQQEHG